MPGSTTTNNALESFNCNVFVEPLILFATLGGIMDGKCIYCSDRSVGATTLLVSWTLPPLVSLVFQV
jgi:hypothetical protein